MKTTLRIAAAVAALAMTAAMTAGCRNEKQITEDLAAALAGSELLLALNCHYSCDITLNLGNLCRIVELVCSVLESELEKFFL